jgi:ABC-type glycerol-3-phosphate transport system substrate-binding protein
MNAKLVIVLGFLVAAGALVFFSMRKKDAGPDTPGPTGTTSPTAPVAPKDKVTISLLYSTEKKEWIEAVVAEFQKAHPEIQVDLVGKGSIDAAQEIIDDKTKPTMWSPADSLVLHMAMDDWETKSKKPLFPTADEDAPQPLVITPLVFAIWEDRADVLLKASNGAVSWKALRTATPTRRARTPACRRSSSWRSSSTASAPASRSPIS